MQIELGSRPDSWEWTFAPGFAQEAARLVTLAREDALSDQEIVKENKHRAIFKISLESREFYLKLHDPRRIQYRLSEFVQGRRAWREWRALRAFEKCGLPVVLPVAVARPRRFYQRGSLVITSGLLEPESLRSFLQRREGGPRREAVLRNTMEVLAQMENLGLRHPDLHPGNLLLEGGATMPRFADFHRSRPLGTGDNQVDRFFRCLEDLVHPQEYARSRRLYAGLVLGTTESSLESSKGSGA